LPSILLVAVPLAAAPAVPRAQEPAPPGPDLGALVREGLENNPALRAAGARLEAARRLPTQAGALPDPEASLGYTNEGTSDFTLGEREDARLSIGYRQEVPYPGKRPTAAAAAEAGAEIAARDLDRLRLQVGAAVKSAYADLYRLDRAAASLAETRHALVSVADSARRRYEAGQGVQESILKAETEVLRLDADLERVTRDRRAAELGLFRALGRGGGPGIGPVRALPDVEPPADLETLAAGADDGSPEVAALLAALRRAEAAVRLARLGLKPDFIWSASYDHRGGLDPMITGMLGVRLPLYRQRKQTQALEQAEAERRAALADLEDGRVRARSEALDLAARVRRADRLVRIIGMGVIPQAAAALESARTSYSVGRLPLLDVLNDLRVLLQARIDLAAEEADRLQALAALEPVLGTVLVEQAAARGGRAPGAARSSERSQR
jgi:outer membrane protein TolC